MTLPYVIKNTDSNVQKFTTTSHLAQKTGKMNKFIALFIVLANLSVSCAQHDATEQRNMSYSKFFYNETDFIGFEIRGRGPKNVIFLHGFAASADTWTPLMQYIESNQTTFHLLDLKGHGHSSYNDDRDFSLYAYADIVHKYIVQNKINNPTIVGHSLGGTIALLYTIKNTSPQLSSYPEALVLIGAPAYHFSLPLFVTFYSSTLLYNLGNIILPTRTQVTIALKKAYADDSKITNEIINTYVQPLQRPAVQKALRNTAAQIDFDAYAHYMRMLPAITAKTLIIWGEDDAIVETFYGQKLKTDIPNSEILIIPSCGHNLHEECPLNVAKALKRFGI